MPRAYSYLRFSTPEQMKGDSYRRQIQQAERYAAAHGLDLCDDLPLEDRGISAFRGGNTEYGALGSFRDLAAHGYIEKGSFLLVESLDRISRQKPRKALKILEDICEQGITVVTLMDEQIYSLERLEKDPFAMVMSLLIMSRAHEESLIKSRRLSEAWGNKKRRAHEKPLTAACPGWLRMKDDRTGYELIPENAEVVQRIFRETLSGQGQHSIVKGLNSDSVPTFGRAKYWQRSYIAKILTSETVIGTYQPHKIEYEGGTKRRIPDGPAVEGYYPAVVSEEDFQSVQSLRSTSLSPGRGRHAGGKPKNILSSLSVCPKCGSTMIRVNKGAREPIPKLVCSAAKAGAGCQYRSVRLDAVERTVRNEWWRLVDEVPVGENREHLFKFVQRLEERVLGAEAETNQIIDLLVREDSRALRERLRKAERRLSRYERVLKRASDALVKASGKVEQKRLGDLSEIDDPETHDLAEMNAVLRRVVSRVIVDYDSGELLFKWMDSTKETSVSYEWRGPVYKDS